MKKAQIGAAGVLLIQYELLKHEIESAPMTTDAGIDLVLYAPKGKRAVTIQVKTNLKPKKAGGKGKLQLNFWLPKSNPAEMVGLVHLATNRAWLFTHDEFTDRAQQKKKEIMQLYMYTDPTYQPRVALSHENDFEAYRVERRIAELFKR